MIKKIVWSFCLSSIGFGSLILLSYYGNHDDRQFMGLSIVLVVLTLLMLCVSVILVGLNLIFKRFLFQWNFYLTGFIFALLISVYIICGAKTWKDVLANPYIQFNLISIIILVLNGLVIRLRNLRKEGSL